MARLSIKIRLLTLVGSIAWILAACGMLVDAGQRGGKQFKVVGVLFDHKDNNSFFSGKITEQQYHAWFKQDYPVLGERIETPQNATSFGTLIATDGEEILVMPFFKWGSESSSYFACQSQGIGRAPKFTVLQPSEKEFLKIFSAKLNEIAQTEENSGK
jgi:hypothetical protein